ncbi:hypothetical protein D5R81_19870 [Parashewanella spongiae]|uniref:DUF3892 domain-containing protein n=1 Tax=Parashewanella spongiae TaxID=342950 RepID=A0A3A6T1E6_9GAMM|nr:hypothetical protein [Parashewanella spongiae]MCL1080277.1 hypothetical protein [Parashewanella spongiae]RJY01627.1 hypothetical protein D5R81_19870 [Parashewanella spongiae]
MNASKKPPSGNQKKIQRNKKIKQRKKYKFIFINGKQVKVQREPEIDGQPVDDFIRENAGSIWLHQNELWHLINTEDEIKVDGDRYNEDDLEIPF